MKYVCRLSVLLLLGLILPAFGQKKTVDAKFAVLELRTEVYTNVTVTTTMPEMICFTHSRGMGTVKVVDLPDEVKAALGYEVEVKRASAKELTEQVKEKLSSIDLAPLNDLRESLQSDTGGGARFDPAKLLKLLLPVLGVMLVLFLFFSYCSKLICEKTGNKPGVLVWLPVFQLIPLLKAAGMSPVWFLAFCIPLVNFIAALVWAVKITKARGKHGFVAFLLILPVTNLFAFLYLAFSSGTPKDDEGAGKPQRRVELMTLETA